MSRPSPAQRDDHTRRHYTRADVAAEGQGRPPLPMETVMNRIVIAALITAISVTAAQAGTVTVRHGDLNLASPAGVETLKTRVQTAAQTACGPVQADFGVSARTLYEAQAEQKACISRTSARAMTRILQARAGSPVTRIARQ